MWLMKAPQSKSYLRRREVSAERKGELPPSERDEGEVVFMGLAREGFDRAHQGGQQLGRGQGPARPERLRQPNVAELLAAW